MRHHHRRHHHHHCHPEHSAVASFLAMTHVLITQGIPLMSTVTLVATVPTTRKSGAALVLADILKIQLSRNGAVLDSVVPTGPTVQFVDSTPLTGNDDYTVETFTTDGLVSDPSNTATVTVVGADPASAITDLTATLA